MIVLNDRGQTRVNLAQITSYTKDYDLMPPNGKVTNIILSIGSAIKKIQYHSEELRDKDYERLDQLFNVDSNLR